MEFGALMKKMTSAVCAGDGDGVASCFCEDGIYHDVFYGAFQGHARIKEMVEGYFHRDAKDFRWDLHDPIDNGKHGYVRYVFSYESTRDDARGKRAMFEGVGVVDLENGLIKHYSEVANTATGLEMMGYPAERMQKIFAKQGRELVARPEAAGHAPDN